jgi:hypothetical protein
MNNGIIKPQEAPRGAPLILVESIAVGCDKLNDILIMKIKSGTTILDFGIRPDLAPSICGLMAKVLLDLSRKIDVVSPAIVSNQGAQGTGVLR